MFKNITNQYNLILKKGQTVKIILRLIFNMIFLGLLRFKKLLRRINKPIIHYYAICWNEEKMLPFVFDYYEDIVDRFIIYDNYSNDKTLELVSKNKKAKAIQYNTEGKINDEIYLKIKNNVWKKSRGKADYVIVCDIDEILYHPELNVFLNDSFKSKYSFFGPNGYEMFSEKFPIYDGKHIITDIVKNGFSADKYSKSILFDPHRIVEINYLPGAHQAFPYGIVKRYESDSLKLFHYKNMGIEYVLNRVSQYHSRLSDVNKQKGYGVEYEKEIDTIRNEFQNGLSKSKEVI